MPRSLDGLFTRPTQRQAFRQHLTGLLPAERNKTENVAVSVGSLRADENSSSPLAVAPSTPERWFAAGYADPRFQRGTWPELWLQTPVMRERQVDRIGCIAGRPTRYGAGGATIVWFLDVRAHRVAKSTGSDDDGSSSPAG